MDAAQLLLGNRLFTIDVPTCWDDLTPEQYEKVNFIKCTTTDSTALLFEVLMLLIPLTKKHLIGLVQLLWQEGKYVAAIDAATMLLFFNHKKLWKFLLADDVIDALAAIEWIFDPSYKQTKSQIRSITYKRIQYEGIRNAQMGGVVWKQMQHADQLANNFAQTGLEKWLTHLAAVLYLPKDAAFTDADDSIPDRIKLFEGLPRPLKFAIYSNYVHLRETFYRGFRLPHTSDGGRPDWTAVTLSVADLGALGTFKEVEKQAAHTVMKYFEKKHKEQPQQ